MEKPIRSLPALRDPEPRIQLMDELGIDRALMWPTLASLLEERLRDDPPATHAVVHGLNEWLHEHWTFDYEGRIFPTPVVSLYIVERAIEELEWVLERGARVILVRPAPVPGLMGPRSPALVDELHGLPGEDVRRVMGGNLARLMGSLPPEPPPEPGAPAQPAGSSGRRPP